ncbi:unnamed protein product, partial [Brenthis ino]
MGGGQLQAELNGQQEPGHLLVADVAAGSVLRHGPLRDDAPIPRGHRADDDRPASVSVQGAGGVCYGVRAMGTHNARCIRDGRRLKCARLGLYRVVPFQ